MSNVSMIDGHIDEPRMSKQEYTPADMLKKMHICILGFCNDCNYKQDYLYDCRKQLIKEVYHTIIVDENVIEHQLQKIKQQQEQINGLIAGQETLQKHLAEKNAEIEMLQSDLERYRQGINNLMKKMGG